MQTTELLGYIAAVLTTIAFLPQALKTYRTKSARDLSLPMFLLFTTGVLVWFIYGWLINSSPIMYANACTMLLASSILYHKLKYD